MYSSVAAKKVMVRVNLDPTAVRIPGPPQDHRHCNPSPRPTRSLTNTVCQRQFVTRTVYTLLNADSNRTFKLVF